MRYYRSPPPVTATSLSDLDWEAETGWMNTGSSIPAVLPDPPAALLDLLAAAAFDDLPSKSPSKDEVFWRAASREGCCPGSGARRRGNHLLAAGRLGRRATLIAAAMIWRR